VGTDPQALQISRRQRSGSNGNAVCDKPFKTKILGRNCHYDEELRRLQIELVKMQEWIRHRGLKVVVLFEGRDAAGKGGAIKRITQA